MNPTCDRRKSRAARFLLINKTLPILLHYYDKTGNAPSSPIAVVGEYAPGSLSRHEMELYRDSLRKLMTHPDSCILNPDRDIFWQEEFHHQIVSPNMKLLRGQKSFVASTLTAIASTMAKYRDAIATAGGGGGSRFLHKCHVCEKTFYSRYYLDMHMERMHSRQHSHAWKQEQQQQVHDDDVVKRDESSNQLCPAKDLCYLLGGTLCDRQAFQNEPYYAPGMVHLGNVAASISAETLYTTTTSAAAAAAAFATTTTTVTYANANSNTNTPDSANQGHGRKAGIPRTQGHDYRLDHLPSSPLQVKRHYQRLTHSQPCNEIQLEQSREFCKSSMEQCFQGRDDDLQRDMMGILCDTQTCHSHLQMLFSNIVSVHALKQEWDRHQMELLQQGWWGRFLTFVVGLVFLAWKVSAFWKDFCNHNQRKKSFQGMVVGRHSQWRLSCLGRGDERTCTLFGKAYASTRRDWKKHKES